MRRKESRKQEKLKTAQGGRALVYTVNIKHGSKRGNNPHKLLSLPAVPCRAGFEPCDGMMPN